MASVAVTGGVPFDEPIVGWRRVWFPAGHYTLVVHAEGFADQPTDLDLQGHAAATFRIVLQRAPVVEVPSGSDVGSAGSADAGSASEGSASTTGSGSAAIVPTPPAILGHRWRTPAIATAITGVTAGLSVTFWAIARSRASSAGKQADPTLYGDDAHAAVAWQHASWVTAGVAGIGAIISGYLLVPGARRTCPDGRAGSRRRRRRDVQRPLVSSATSWVIVVRARSSSSPRSVTPPTTA